MNTDWMFTDRTFYSLVGSGVLLQVSFLGLKLSHVVGWSWWWVTAPAWITLLIIAGLCWIVWMIFRHAE